MYPQNDFSLSPFSLNVILRAYSIWKIIHLALLILNRPLLNGDWLHKIDISVIIFEILVSCILILLFKKYGSPKYLQHNNLEVGHFMAFMYFHGYLKKCLPVSEIQHQPELAARIKNYEEIEKVSIPIKKLLLLIPKSGIVEPIIGKESDHILIRKNLESFSLNRAGIVGRSYANTPYKIFLDKTNGKHTTVVAEYVTCLSTITEVFKELPEFYSSIKKMVLESFQYKLKKLLDDNPDCGKYCEIISFDDEKKDAVTALRERINQISGGDHFVETNCRKDLFENDNHQFSKKM